MIIKSKYKQFFANVFLLITCVILSINVYGQNDKKLIREGNKQYKNGKYSDSEINYRKGLEKNKESVEGAFNLGDALYKQGKYEEAANQFKSVTGKKTDKDAMAKVYHNLGNSLLESKKYEESASAYKEALKNKPDDKDTKYNLAYAQAMLRQQQQQQKQQNKDDKNKKDDKKDQNKKDQKDKDNKDKKDNKQQDQKQDQQQKKDQQQQNAKQPKISKEDAERMLQALNNKEKDIQKKLEKKEGVRVKAEKDW